jgi:tetratricopeptide (TPR) repeat protein
MHQEEQIIAAYRQKQRELAADEDIIRQTKHQGEQLIQKAMIGISQTFQHSERNDESLAKARQAIAQLEENYYAAIAKETKKVEQRYEEAEQTYRQALQRTQKEN